MLKTQDRQQRKLIVLYALLSNLLLWTHVLNPFCSRCASETRTEPEYSPDRKLQLMMCRRGLAENVQRSWNVLHGALCCEKFPIFRKLPRLEISRQQGVRYGGIIFSKIVPIAASGTGRYSDKH